MGRPRKHHLDLPERVYFEDGRYRYKPKGAKPVELGTDIVEALVKHKKLAPSVTPRDTAQGPWWRDLRTMGEWGDAYMQIEAPKKARASYLTNIKEWRKLKPEFAHLLPSEMSQKLMKRYVRNRAVKALVRANREKALMSAMLSWIVNVTDQEVLAVNPLYGMKKKDTDTSEFARDRLILDKELDVFLAAGGEKLVLYCRLKDLIRARQKDILTLEVSHLKEDGIEFLPSKTRRRHPRTGKPLGRPRFFPYAQFPGAREIVDRLLEIKRGDEKRLRRITPWLMVTARGKCYYNFERAEANAFSGLWQRCMRRAQAMAKAQGWELERFTEHDMRARKGATSHLLGNTEAVFKKHYDRGPEVVEPLRRGS